MMLNNLKRFCIKVSALFTRLLRVVFWLPRRIFRLFRHVGDGFSRLINGKRPAIPHWWLEFAFLAMDLVGLPEVVETIFDFAKWDTRPLSPLEKKLAASVFGDALPLDDIRIDNRARLGCKKRHIAYVSYFTVNAWGSIRPEIFIHELVHVWQFLKYGGAYMPMALRAQSSKEGYNYGGVAALRTCKEKNGKLTDFNLEQQADIVSDYFAIREGLKPAWGKGTKEDLPVYEYFLSQIRIQQTA